MKYEDRNNRHYHFFMVTKVQAANNPDAIVGKRPALPKKNLMVEVFRLGKVYKARVAWLSDMDDASTAGKAAISMMQSQVEPGVHLHRLLKMVLCR